MPAPGDDVTILGAVVRVSDARTVDGSFTLGGGGQIQVIGPEGSLVVNGAANIDNGRVYCVAQGLLDLHTVTSYAWERCESATLIDVEGAAHIDLSGLTQLVVDVPSCGALQEFIFILGGTLDLSALETIDTPTGQQVSFSQGLSGDVLLDSLSTMDGITIGTDATAMIEMPALTSWTGGSIVVTAGGTVSANALENMSGVTLIPGDGDAIQLNGLSMLSNSLLTSPGNDQWTLPALETITNTSVQIGENSLLDVPSLTALNSTTGAHFLSAGSGGMINAPNLINIANITITANPGAVINLPAVTTVTWSVCTGTISFLAGGADAVIDLPALKTLALTGACNGGTGFPAFANDGGVLDLSGLTTISIGGQQSIAFNSTNADSVIDLSSLRNFNAALVFFFEFAGGRIIRFSGPIGGGNGCAASSSATSSDSQLLDAFCLCAVVIALGAYGRLLAAIERPAGKSASSH